MNWITYKMQENYQEPSLIEYFISMIKNKRIRKLILIGLSLIFILCFSIAYFYHKNDVKLYENLKNNGHITKAISYRDECSRNHKGIRYYKFEVGGVQYHSEFMPEQSDIVICDSPFGDLVTVHYLSNNPNKNMSQWQLDNHNKMINYAKEFRYFLFISFIFVGTVFMVFIVNPLSTKISDDKYDKEK